MPRRKTGIKQEHFDFAITPRTDEDRAIVAALREMQADNQFSMWIRSMIYKSFQTSNDNTQSPEPESVSARD